MKLLRLAPFVILGLTAAPIAGFAQDTPSGPKDAVVDVDTAAVAGNADLGQPAGPAPTPEHTGIRALLSDFLNDVKHVPSQPNLWIAAIGGGAALAAHPADVHATPYLVDASWAHNVFAAGAIIGDTPELLGMSIGTYIVGRSKGNGKVSHVGMDMLQAIMLNEVLVETLKYATRRQRPDGSGANSFPSGHASNTFAVATALERHAGWKLAGPAYAVATYVAASRLHDNRHYLSDVVFGSAVGILAGRTVTRHGRAFPVTVAAVPGGAALVYAPNGK